MKHLLIYLYFFLVFLEGQDWAGQPGGFLRMGMTARSVAMGGGFTAELDNSFVTFHNPAWAAFLTKKYVGSSYTNLSLDRRLAATSISTSLPPTAGFKFVTLVKVAEVFPFCAVNEAGESVKPLSPLDSTGKEWGKDMIYDGPCIERDAGANWL